MIYTAFGSPIRITGSRRRPGWLISGPSYNKTRYTKPKTTPPGAMVTPVMLLEVTAVYAPSDPDSPYKECPVRDGAWFSIADLRASDGMEEIIRVCEALTNGAKDNEP